LLAALFVVNVAAQHEGARMVDFIIAVIKVLWGLSITITIALGFATLVSDRVRTGIFGPALLVASKRRKLVPANDR